MTIIQEQSSTLKTQDFHFPRKKVTWHAPKQKLLKTLLEQLQVGK